MDQQILTDDKQTNGSEITLGSYVIHRHIGDFSVLCGDGHIQSFLSVGNAGLGDNGNVLAAVDMGFHDLLQVHIAKDAGVSKDHIFLIAVYQKVHSAVERVQLATVATGGAAGIGGQEFQTALLQLQIPFFTGADVVHQGLIVVAGDDADVANAAVGHVGQGEVDLTVTAAVGQGSHSTLVGQLTQRAVVNIRENNTHQVHSFILPYSISPGSRTLLAGTMAFFWVTLICLGSLAPNVPPTTALAPTRLLSPRMA